MSVVIDVWRRSFPLKALHLWCFEAQLFQTLLTPVFVRAVTQISSETRWPRCLIARGLYNTRHLTNRAVIKVNSESPLSVSALSPSASQRTTRPRRTWRDTRRTRPTPTLSVTTWPIWEPLPGTRRNTATRSAWRQAMVGVTANVTPLASSQLEPLNKNTGDRLIKIATL